MRSLLIGLVGAAVIGTGGYAAASGLDDAEPARTISLPGATTGDGTTITGTTTLDTTTVGRTTTGTTTARTTTTGAGVDISGRCDEAEHADDPRCTGGVTGGNDRDDDHSGPGRGGDDDRDDDDDEDRSGSNRGRG
ncbi:MAG TPA: hypothetical protein VM184_09510 [Gaiellaceae bacterium]|nr:hypothetical protein [Gaiellaceae bacterium]